MLLIHEHLEEPPAHSVKLPVVCISIQYLAVEVLEDLDALALSDSHLSDVAGGPLAEGDGCLLLRLGPHEQVESQITIVVGLLEKLVEDLDLGYLGAVVIYSGKQVHSCLVKHLLLLVTRSQEVGYALHKSALLGCSLFLALDRLSTLKQVLCMLEAIEFFDELEQVLDAKFLNSYHLRVLHVDKLDEGLVFCSRLRTLISLALGCRLRSGLSLRSGCFSLGMLFRRLLLHTVSIVVECSICHFIDFIFLGDRSTRG